MDTDLQHHRQLDGGFGRHRPYLMLPPNLQRAAFIKAGAANRADAAETAYFSRQLESLWKRAYTVKYGEMKGRLFVPKDTETAPWAEGYRYVAYDSFGAAALLKTGAENIPSCDVAGKEFFGRCWGYGTSFGWSVMEGMQADATGNNLRMEKQGTSRRILEERIDDTLAKGDPTDFNAYGLLNNPNVPLMVLTAGVDGFVEWDKKTPLEVVKDLNRLVNSIPRRTNEVERPTTIVMPPGARSYIATTPMSADFPQMTILRYFLENNEHIKDPEAIQTWKKCDDAGVGATARLVCFTQTEDHLRGIVPMEYTMLPPEVAGFRTRILAHVRCGGVQWMYPLSGVYVDNFISASLLNG
jgi:hypothetical protein